MTRPGIEPRSPGPLANTLTARPTLYMYLIKHYIYSKVNLATVDEGDQKAPFSIATTPRCR